MTSLTDPISRTETLLLERLQTLGISVQVHRHPALHTVEESKALRDRMPGVHVKNLVLRDKKGRIWLITAHEDTALDLKALRHSLGASGTLSFCNAELLASTLGVTPGSATPLAVINDVAGRVSAVFDRRVLAGELINVHPLHNEATLSLAPADLLEFMTACDHAPLIMDFARATGLEEKPHSGD